MQTLGVLTIGQSPRPDILSEMKQTIGDTIEIVEAGALDGLTRNEIASLAPGADDTLLVTRLADGTSVSVAEKYITPRLQQKLHNFFDKNVPVVLLLCTGGFPELEGKGLILRPDTILLNTVRAVGAGHRIGVLCPEENQIGWMLERWKEVNPQTIIQAVSPYGPLSDCTRAAVALKNAGAEMLVLDCMAYTNVTQTEVRRVTGLPVVLASGIVAHVVKELLG
jgi:protein AroM